jgi:GrpB-like predicted nucleotidyltransferase (UPF0157 family)
VSRDVHDSVVIVPPDASWAVAFEHAKVDLLVALGGRVLAIEHIGSTSVPGLAAKPVIDLLLGVPALDDVGACVPILEARGWQYPLDMNRDLVGRRFFMKRDAEGVRTHHAHFVVHRGPLWSEYLTFRDALRGSQTLRDRYEHLKRDLAAKYHDQRERYTASKTDFVKEVLGLGADEEPQSRG